MFDKLYEKEVKEILADKYATAHDKAVFADKIKNGLGKELKANPNKVKIIKITKKEKIVAWLKKIFTKF